MRKKVRFLYTVLFLIEIYLPVKFQVGTSYSFCVMHGQYIGKLSETTGPTKAFHVEGKRKKAYSNDLGHFCQPPGSGAFSRDFITNFAGLLALL